MMSHNRQEIQELMMRLLVARSQRDEASDHYREAKSAFDEEIQPVKHQRSYFNQRAEELKAELTQRLTDHVDDPELPIKPRNETYLEIHDLNQLMAFIIDHRLGRWLQINTDKEDTLITYLLTASFLGELVNQDILVINYDEVARSLRKKDTALPPSIASLETSVTFSIPDKRLEDLILLTGDGDPTSRLNTIFNEEQELFKQSLLFVDEDES